MDNQLFKKFVDEMNTILEKNETEDGRNQKKLLEELSKNEKKFKKILLSSADGKEIYQQFMDFILNEKRNILSCRSYFRERQEVFSDKISKAFHKRKANMLYKFNINHSFIKWTMDRYNGENKEKLKYYYDNVIKTRKMLCENNLPLAINRAKVFWSKVPESPVEYMDIVQASAEGLLNAIDKFVLPYKEVFKSVMVGRMMLNISNDHNDTLVKMSSHEKRILYRANTIKKREVNISEVDVLKYVKEKFKNVSARQLQEIVAAVNGNVSLDYTDKNTKTKIQDIVADEDPSPETCCIIRELAEKLYHIINKLPVLQMKILKMKMGIKEQNPNDNIGA